MPFSIAAAGILLESTSQIRTSAAHDAVAGPTIAHKADAARQRCALSLGANSPSSKSGFQGRTADAVCCALAWILLYLEDAAYCVFSKNYPCISNLHANAVAHLLHLQ
jgi:hypothetical protein